MRVPLANTRAQPDRLVALPIPLLPPSTVNRTLPSMPVNLRVVFAAQFTAAPASS